MNGHGMDGSSQKWLAALMGLAMPGLGQIYNGELIKGFSYFVILQVLYIFGFRWTVLLPDRMLLLGAAELFIRNNDVSPLVAASAARLGGSMAIVLILSGLANKLGERRPAWPLARSFPWSSSRRIAGDALFMAVHGMLPVLLLVRRYPASSAYVLAALPLLAFRAAGYVRLVPCRLAGARRYLVEGAALSAMLTLLSWLGPIMLAAAPLAFLSARRSERDLKVTGWRDFHHAPVGDTLSWSA